MKTLSRIGFASAITVALVLSNSAASFAQKDLPLNPAVTDALYLLDIEQTTKGVEELEKIAAATPTDASLLYYLGYAQLKTGDKAKALATFDKGIALDEKQPLNYVGKGYLNMLEKKPADAKILFDKAIAMTKSKSVAVLKAVAEAYNVDNKYSVESVALLNKAKAINANDPDVYLLLGDTYLIQNVGGNVGSTISAYDNVMMCKIAEAKQKSHFEGKAHFKSGMVYERAKNYEVAIEDFEKSIKSDPGYTPAYRELGQLLYLNKQAARSVEMYEKFLSLTDKPQTMQYQFEYAFVLFMNKDYKKANETFAKVIEMPNVNPLTFRFYSKSLYETADYAKSRELFETYMSKIKPEELEAGDYLYYGNTLLKLNDKDTLGIANLLKSYNMNKSQGDLILQIANSYYKMRNFPKAISAYQELMRARKTPSAQDYFMIGQAFYNNDQLDAADTTFAKFIKMKPELVVGYYWAANVIAKKEEEKKVPEGTAKPYFDKLVEIASPDPVKNKKELVGAYQYIAYYYYDKGDAGTAKATYQKILAIDPNNPQAKEAIDTLDKAIKAAQNPGKPKPKNK